MRLRRAMLLVPLLAAPAFGEAAWKPHWPEAQAEAKKENKCLLLLYFNGGMKDCKRFETDTLSDGKVQAQLRQYVCAKIDPEGSDDDNKLWQQHKMPMPPMTLVFEPDGKPLAEVRSLNPKIYAEALENIAPAYFNRIVPAREALAKEADQPEALVKLGEAYVMLDNPADSAKYFAKAVDGLAKKDKDRALKLLGDQLEQYYSRKWYVPARDCCRKIAELDSADASKLNAKAAWVLGMADCTEGRWNDAIAGLKAACERFKDSPLLDKMMFSLASAHMYAKDKQAALAVFEAIIKKFPDSETAQLAETQANKLR
jgi:tetratricopeptide (TPR) repeat protein